MSKRSKERPDDLPEFQNPFKNSKWWENDIPPEEMAEDGDGMVRADIGKISTALIAELDRRLATGENIVKLGTSKPGVQKKPVKEPKPTWQPDSSWRQPLQIVSKNEIVAEVELLLGDDFEGVGYDFLPFMVQDCASFWPTAQLDFNEIARTAHSLGLLNHQQTKGEAVRDLAAWDYLQSRWGDFGVLLVLASIHGKEEHLLIRPDTTVFLIDSVLTDVDNLLRPLFPLQGLIVPETCSPAKGIRTKLLSHVGEDRYRVWVDPVASLAQYPDWQKALSLNVPLKLSPIHSLRIRLNMSDEISITGQLRSPKK